MQIMSRICIIICKLYSVDYEKFIQIICRLYADYVQNLDIIWIPDFKQIYMGKNMQIAAIYIYIYQQKICQNVISANLEYENNMCFIRL